MIPDALAFATAGLLALAAGRRRLEALYGVDIEDPNLLLAMRHRAVLFGLLGGLLLAAIALEQLFWPAVILTALADLSFAVLGTS